MAAPDAILDEWFPVAVADDLKPGSRSSVTLLDRRLVLVVGDDGAVSMFHDTCPHRGAQLSLGDFDGGIIRCGYHGWEFDMAGRCVHQPAHPDREPRAASGLVAIELRQRYGLLWACLGSTPRNLPDFPAFEELPGQSLFLEPALVASSGPRIVENFLDLAHFPFVHKGYLGEEGRTEIKRYGVDVVDDVLRLSNVTVWQPNPGPRATWGGPVSYNYSLSHPYAATLTKVPSDEDGGELGGFSILLVASPVSEAECLVWRVVTVCDPDVDWDAQRDFNRTIFEQDVPIVESQLPKVLPLEAGEEVHQPADAGSLAYRKWLKNRGIRYGTTAGELTR